jgi:hypothetical protein
MSFELVFRGDCKSEEVIWLRALTMAVLIVPTLKQGLMKLASNRIFYISSGHKS